MEVLLRKNKDEYGILNNMFPLEILYKGELYPSSENLFLVRRIRERFLAERSQIIREKNPFKAKLIYKELTKKNPHILKHYECTDDDLILMEEVLKLKFDQHLIVQETLKETVGCMIREDVTKRIDAKSGLFWGSALINHDAYNAQTYWIGLNHLGNIWMKIRDQKFLSV